MNYTPKKPLNIINFHLLSLFSLISCGILIFRSIPFHCLQKTTRNALSRGRLSSGSIIHDTRTNKKRKCLSFSLCDIIYCKLIPTCIIKSSHLQNILFLFCWFMTRIHKERVSHHMEPSLNRAFFVLPDCAWIKNDQELT